ncbi:MAG: hypothetical protein WBX50_11515 [Candidatus Deferrimicrobiaceae bacterium]
MKKGLLFTVCFMALAALVIAGVSTAAEKGHGSMPGMHGESKMEGHGMMKMGDKVFEGKVGPWHAEGRLMDMKAQMEKAKASGMKMEGMMKNTHHVAFSLTDPATSKPVTEGKGTVMVTGPDNKTVTTDLMGMQGHFGADVNLPVPGEYTFQVEVEAGGKNGSATFHHTVE